MVGGGLSWSGIKSQFSAPAITPVARAECLMGGKGEFFEDELYVPQGYTP